MIMQTKFKVGDKVRALVNHGWSTKGDTYTIAKCWYNSDHTECYVRLVEHLPKGANHSHSADSYELVEPNPVLTPEEVFEHLRKGTKLQWAHKSTENWCNHSGDITRIKVNELIDYSWRIKPEPEVIELNGKRYKLIEE